VHRQRDIQAIQAKDQKACWELCEWIRSVTIVPDALSQIVVLQAAPDVGQVVVVRLAGGGPAASSIWRPTGVFAAQARKSPWDVTLSLAVTGILRHPQALMNPIRGYFGTTDVGPTRFLGLQKRPGPFVPASNRSYTGPRHHPSAPRFPRCPQPVY